MQNKVTILIIEDEKNICDFMATTLKAQGYRTISTGLGREGLSLTASQCPEVILLDLGLPDIDGMEVIRQVRTYTDIPIIVISARTQEREKVMALDLGADDYITKPFGSSELFARIRTALRHSNRMTSQAANRPYQAGGLCIDFDRRLVSVDQEPVHLTQGEFKIVSFLAHNSGRVMTYDTIISHVWGPYADDNNRILRVNMANIRRKLEKNPAEPQFILTEIGVGYRMMEDEAQQGGIN